MLIRLVGADATVDGGALRTSHCAWLVTPECVVTPLIPLFLAAVLAGSRRGWRLLAALGSAAPIFFTLAVARLLVLAIPAALVGSHEVAIHAFYQVAIAAGLVTAVALRSADGGRRIGASLGVALAAALVAGLLDIRALAPALAHGSGSLHPGHGWVAPQGAVDIALAYQVALVAGLIAALHLPVTRRVAGWLSLLVRGQVALRIAVGGVATHGLLEIPVIAVRAWSVAAPIALLWAVSPRSLRAALAAGGAAHSDR